MYLFCLGVPWEYPQGRGETEGEKADPDTLQAEKEEILSRIQKEKEEIEKKKKEEKDKKN